VTTVDRFIDRFDVSTERRGALPTGN